VTDRVTQAPLVFTGIVWAAPNRIDFSTFIYTATVAVSQTIKGGALPTQILINGLGHGAACLTSIDVGESYLFCAARLSNDDVSIYKFLSGASVDVLTTANLEEALNAARQSALPQRTWVPLIRAI
jgi:hypothetical protein